MSVGYVAVYQTSGSGGGGGGGGGGATSCPTTATSNISADCYTGSQGTIGVTSTTDSDPSGVDSNQVEVVLDNPANTPVGSFAVGNTGGWSSWKTSPANISTVAGTHDVYLKFSSGAGGNPPFVSLHYCNFPAH